MRYLNTAASLVIVSTISALVTANYDPNLGLRAMYYSGAAYCDKGTLESWTCGEPCTQNSDFTDF